MGTNKFDWFIRSDVLQPFESMAIRTIHKLRGQYQTFNNCSSSETSDINMKVAQHTAVINQWGFLTISDPC